MQKNERGNIKMTERFVKIKTRINEESQIKIDNKFISMRIENVYIKEEF